MIERSVQEVTKCVFDACSCDVYGRTLAFALRFPAIDPVGVNADHDRGIGWMPFAVIVHGTVEDGLVRPAISRCRCNRAAARRRPGSVTRVKSAPEIGSVTG